MDANYNFIIEKLLEADNSIKEIVLFGSAIYKPDTAKDIDLIILTELDRSELLELVMDFDDIENLDVVIVNDVSEISKSLHMSILVFGVLLYGEGKIFEHIKEVIEVPNDFKEAIAYFGLARNDLKSAFKQKQQIQQEIMVSSAFNKLFDATRTGVQIFLCSEITRWGQLKKKLPAELKSKFGKIIDNCHMKYGYEKRFPTTKKEIEDEFKKWDEYVGKFINELMELRDKNKAS